DNIRVDMIYSHEPLPVLALAAATFALVFAVWRRPALAGWCAALVVLHLLADLVVGFTHHLAGPATPTISLNLYGRAPKLAIAIEAAYAASCVAWYERAERARGRPVARAKARALYGVFALGALLWLPAARTPLGRLVGLR